MFYIKPCEKKSQYNERYTHFKKTCRLATDLGELFLFDQSIGVLRSAMMNDADNGAQYRVLIANTYMAAGRWSQAIEAYESILSGENLIQKDEARFMSVLEAHTSQWVGSKRPSPLTRKELINPIRRHDDCQVNWLWAI